MGGCFIVLPLGYFMSCAFNGDSRQSNEATSGEEVLLNKREADKEPGGGEIKGLAELVQD